LERNKTLVELCDGRKHGFIEKCAKKTREVLGK